MKSTLMERPWGTEDLFVQNKQVTVKLINVKVGEALSLQYHEGRDEFWRVLSGNPELTVGDDLIEASPGQEFSINKGIKHRISAPKNDVTILEVSTGDFDENDIIRLEDKYGRV